MGLYEKRLHFGKKMQLSLKKGFLSGLKELRSVAKQLKTRKILFKNGNLCGFTLLFQKQRGLIQ
jgi:hypothetical protein